MSTNFLFTAAGEQDVCRHLSLITLWLNKQLCLKGGGSREHYISELVTFPNSMFSSNLEIDNKYK